MPRLADDGRTVELDLHHTRLREAKTLLRQTVRLAAARGRAQVRIVHGYSTTDGQTATIKQTVHTLLDDRAFPQVSSALRSDGSTLLALRFGRHHDPRRLTLRDVA